MLEPLGNIFINACLVNNFVLSYFLGICPFLGVSGKVSTAARMGLAVIFVMLVSSLSASGIHFLLDLLDALYLQLIAYITVIAATVQLVEMFLKKTSPALSEALGIFLPLITTNCAILGVALFQTNREYNLLESAVFSLGAGTGFALALILMATLREEMELSDPPRIFRGAALTLILAGILSLAFMGFVGMAG